MITQLQIKAVRYYHRLVGPNSLHERLARGVLWSLLGGVFGQGFKLVMSIVVARYLGQVGFGELGMITNTAILFGVFAGMGLGLTATKYVADSRSRDPEYAGRIIGLLLKVAAIASALVSLVVFLLSPTIADSVLNAPHLTTALRISCLMLFLNSLYGVQIGALAGLESFRVIALISFFEGLIGLFFISLGAWLLGLQGAVWGYVMAASITWLVSQVVLRRQCKQNGIIISFQGTRAQWLVLWSFGLPAFFVLVSTQPFTWLSRVILANQSDGYAELGLLNAAFAWGAVLLFLPRQISKPTMPILSSLYGENRRKEFSEMLRLNLMLTMGTAFLIAFPLMLLSPLIMRSYGDAFENAWPVLLFLLIAYTISAGTLTFRDAMASSGQMWLQVLQSVIWGMALIAVTIMLSDMGALGVAIAFLVAYIVLFTIQLAYLVFSGMIDVGAVLRRAT